MANPKMKDFFLIRLKLGNRKIFRLYGKRNIKMLRLKIKEDFSNKDIISEKERDQGKQDGIKKKVKRNRFKMMGTKRLHQEKKESKVEMIEGIKEIRKT